MKGTLNTKTDSGSKNEVDPFAVFGLNDMDNFFISSNQNTLNSELDRLVSETEGKGGSKDTSDLEKASSPQLKGSDEGYLQKIARYVSMAYFKELFDINTDDVIDRVKYSLLPMRSRNLFQNKPFDLYGPIWIVLTTVFTTSIFGTVFMTDNSGLKDKATSVSIHQIGKSFTLTLFYILSNSFALYYLFKKEDAGGIKYIFVWNINMQN